MNKIMVRFRILRLLGFALLVAGVAGLWYFNNSSRLSGYPIPADDKAFYGVQLDWQDDSIEAYAERLGKTPKLFGAYTAYPLDDEFKKLVNQNIAELASSKSTLMITLEPWDGLESINEKNLRDITDTLQGWNDQGLPILVRFAHEMNGAWYPWAQQPTSYVANFRLVADAVHKTTLSSILWSPNEAGGYPYYGGKYEISPANPDFKILDTNKDGTIDMSDDPYTPYYPGDEFVDWVGLSVYHFGTAWPWGTNTIPEDGKLIRKIGGTYRNDSIDESALPDFYNEFSKNRNKPFAISETSALFIDRPNNGEANIKIKKAWISQVYSDS